MYTLQNYSFSSKPELTCSTICCQLSPINLSFPWLIDKKLELGTHNPFNVVPRGLNSCLFCIKLNFVFCLIQETLNFLLFIYIFLSYILLLPAASQLLMLFDLFRQTSVTFYTLSEPFDSQQFRQTWRCRGVTINGSLKALSLLWTTPSSSICQLICQRNYDYILGK